MSPVEHVRWTSRPGPGVTGSTRTVMIAAFSGWNDAGDAATGAIDHLWEQWGAQQFASVDPEEFMDFTATRPEAKVKAGIADQLQWPSTDFGWCSLPGGGSVVLVRGPEPNHRWRTFSETLLGVATELGCSAVITVGALLSEVPHTRPTPVFSTAHESHLIDALPLPTSNYEGPTGIPAALHEAAHLAGFDAVALWAATPAYAAGVPSPKGALALVEQIAAVVGAAAPIDDLLEQSDEYEKQLDSLVAEDEDTLTYLRGLEEGYDSDSVALRSGDELVEEVENFLRDQ